MADSQPYIEAHPGDLLTAGAWNQLQIDVKQDIAKEIEAAKDDVRHNPVDKAKNSDEFAGKTEDQWTTELDGRYAPKTHNHEGQTVRKRYIKQFRPDLLEALLPHGLAQFPLVDLYELLPVATTGDAKFTAAKILLFSGHADADDLGLRVRVYRDRSLRGVMFARLANDIGLHYTDESSFADVVNDFWNQFMLDPNDEIEHAQTAWISETSDKERTVADLKRTGEWDDLYVGLNPRRCGLGARLEGNVDGQLEKPWCRVTVSHVNYDTLHIQADGSNWPRGGSLAAPGDPDLLDLMLLLRI